MMSSDPQANMLKRLDRIISLLEVLVIQNERGDYVPMEPDMPEPPRLPVAPIPWEAQRTQCDKCGMEFGGVVGYACVNVDCPTGLGPTVS